MNSSVCRSRSRSSTPISILCKVQISCIRSGIGQFHHGQKFSAQKPTLQFVLMSCRLLPLESDLSILMVSGITRALLPRHIAFGEPCWGQKILSGSEYFSAASLVGLDKLRQACCAEKTSFRTISLLNSHEQKKAI